MDHFIMALIRVERARFAYLHLICKIVIDILKNNSIGPSKECQDVLYEFLFIVIQGLPIIHVLREIYFFRSPIAHLSLFIKFPEMWILQGEDCKSVEGGCQEGFVFLLHPFLKFKVVSDVTSITKYLRVGIKSTATQLLEFFLLNHDLLIIDPFRFTQCDGVVAVLTSFLRINSDFHL